MAQIQLRRSLAGQIAPPGPGTGLPAEPIYSLGGFTAALPAHTGGNELAIHNGTAYASLIGPQRQVELIGVQTVGGRKTFTLGSISITGGQLGEVLTTDGAGTLSWGPGGGNAPTYNFNIGLTETGGVVDLLPATPTVIGGVFVGATAASGLILTPASGALALAVATPTQFGGVSVPAAGGLELFGANGLRVFPATQAEATTGTDAFKPITATVLQLGPDPRTLQTTAKTLVGAINEIAGILSTVTGLLTIVGTFNAAGPVANEVTPITGSPLAPGPLPVANASRVGYFLLVDTPGTPGAGSNAPQVPMVVNDMIVCVEAPPASSTYSWAHVKLGQAVIAATNVTVTAIPGNPANNVQDALAFLQANKLNSPLNVDANSLSGNGQATPLAVNVVDGGTFP